MTACPECGCWTGHTPACTYLARIQVRTTSTDATPLACEHGQLARSCDYCERDAEIARLRAENERLTRRYAEDRGYFNAAEMKFLRMEDDIEALKRVVEAGIAAKRMYDVMPWCRDKPEGDYTCVVSTAWKEFNYGPMHDLNEAIEALPEHMR